MKKNLMVLNLFYYNGRFEDAFLFTKNNAGETLRRLSKGQADVFRLWLNQRNSTTEKFESGLCNCVKIMLMKDVG